MASGRSLHGVLRRLGTLALLVPLLLAACDTNATPTTGPTTGPTATTGGAPPATVAGTGDNTPGPAQPTTTPMAAGSGGTLRWANEGVNEIDTLDPPAAQSSNAIMAIGLIFDGLIRLDDRLNLQPAGAENWEISGDGKTYTFFIRKNLKWADGSPVTAEDFRWSLERALSKQFANGSAGYYLSNIKGASDWIQGKGSGLTGVKVKDPQTLTIELEKPGVYFLYQLTYAGAAVVPKKLIDQYGDKWIEHAWGTGPFMLKEWKHSQSLTFTPNTNYWRGVPALAGVEMPFIQDPETAYRLYQTGDLDIVGSQQFPPAHIAENVGKPGFVQLPQFFDAYVGFNNAKPPLDNAKLRRALALAVDKKTLADKVMNGAVVAADHIVPPGIPGFNNNLKPLSFDAAAAKQALADAGFPDGKGLPKLTLFYTTGQADFDKVSATLQQMWKQNLGLDIAVQGEEQGKYNNDLTAMANDPANSNLQIYLSVWGADYPDPQNFLSQQLRTGVGNNNGHFSNAEFDKLVDQADLERDPNKRYPAYGQAEQIAIDEVGWLPLYHGKGSILINPSVKGLTYTAQGLFAGDWTKVFVQK
jgi:peptide/nickel transport system substrate-binding protein/oligopeptide transport system substrate-binding protein